MTRRARLSLDPDRSTDKPAVPGFTPSPDQAPATAHVAQAPPSPPSVGSAPKPEPKPSSPRNRSRPAGGRDAARPFKVLLVVALAAAAVYLLGKRLA